ncbi:hypothetical protein O3P69_004462 [Scylla paramamosain]|uniref:Uncharacterized protein n=1 Tax=Scylla paramamosain TaxID=85552 RepID=A0AAW0UEN6_SCYPA
MSVRRLLEGGMSVARRAHTIHDLFGVASSCTAQPVKAVKTSAKWPEHSQVLVNPWPGLACGTMANIRSGFMMYQQRIVYSEPRRRRRVAGCVRGELCVSWCVVVGKEGVKQTGDVFPPVWGQLVREVPLLCPGQPMTRCCSWQHNTAGTEHSILAVMSGQPFLPLPRWFVSHMFVQPESGCPCPWWQCSRLPPLSVAHFLLPKYRSVGAARRYQTWWCADAPRHRLGTAVACGTVTNLLQARAAGRQHVTGYISVHGRTCRRPRRRTLPLSQYFNLFILFHSLTIISAQPTPGALGAGATSARPFLLRHERYISKPGRLHVSVCVAAQLLPCNSSPTDQSTTAFIYLLMITELRVLSPTQLLASLP